MFDSRLPIAVQCIVYISRLRVENWKNFKTVDVALGDRVFLIGPNASGKSNFLDIFRFLRDLSISGGGLQQAVINRGSVSAIRALTARRYSDVTIDVDLSEDANQPEWRYKISFSQDNNSRPVIKTERVEYKGSVIIDRPNNDDNEDTLRLTETALEQTSANREFRAIVQYFQTISYQHLLPQVIRDPQGFSPGKVDNDPFGRDFLQRVDNTTEKSRNARLTKILSALRVAVPNLKEIRTERDSLGIPHLVGMYEHWRPGAGRQNESQFSDGTLRLFGLLWSLFEGNGPLLMEEPELSLHEEVVRYLPQIIESINRQRRLRRQVIVSTHSETLLSDKSINAHFVLRLEPSSEGTTIHLTDEFPEDRVLLQNGLSVAEVVFPRSAPKGANQLALLFDL